MDAASKKGANIIDLHKKKATRSEFEGRIKKTNPSLVILNGHGDEDCVTGHDNEVLVKAGENEDLLKNRITYAVSCNSAKKLGPSCIDKKTAYIGYKESFIFNIDRRYFSRPLEDRRAARFLNASNQVALSLIKGHTAAEATARSQALFKQAIRSLLTSTNTDPQSLDDMKNLLWNMRHLVCLGAKDAKI